jgi:hypothetical protein
MTINKLAGTSPWHVVLACVRIFRIVVGYWGSQIRLELPIQMNDQTRLMVG